MYERFTDRARKVMVLAETEARRFDHEYIGTEHILSGLSKEGSGVAATVLEGMKVDLRKVRLEIERVVQRGRPQEIVGRLPLTPRARKVIDYALEEAHNLHDKVVGTEHLLLALLRESEDIVVVILGSCGAKPEEVRANVLRLLGAGTVPSTSPAEKLEIPGGLWSEVHLAIEQLQLMEKELARMVGSHADFFQGNSSQFMWVLWARSHVWQASTSLQSILDGRDFTPIT
jgi:ATP-dependent Clp protease ATP-binding subunit ClpC